MKEVNKLQIPPTEIEICRIMDIDGLTDTGRLIIRRLTYQRDQLLNKSNESLVTWALELGLATGHADTKQDLLDEIGSQIEDMQDKLHKISQWAEAYPIKIFPEPDLKKATKVLEENSMTLDSISASNMRHVLQGVKDIINT